MQFQPDWKAVVLAESCLDAPTVRGYPLLGRTLNDPCFVPDWIEPYANGQIRVVDDVATSPMPPCHRQFLENLRIRAKILVPIQVGDTLWGLMLVSQNDAPRAWQVNEIDLMQQLATHVSIAVQQASTYEQMQQELAERQRAEAALQQLNQNLEARVQQRTAELQEREVALQKSVHDFQVLVGNIPGVVYRRPLGKDQVGMYISEGIYDIVGYPAQDLSAAGHRTYASLVEPEDWPVVEQTIHAAIAQRQQFTLEYRLCHADASHRWVYEKGQGIFDDEGNLLWVDGVIVDISDRKRAEARLQESEARYRSAIASLVEGIVVQQADGQIVTCNQSAERIVGLTLEQMQGLVPVEFERRTIREDGAPFLSQDYPATVTLRTGAPQIGVVMGICYGDRPTKWISINSQPLLHPGKRVPYAVVVSFVDITDQRKAQEILRHQADTEHVLALTDGLTQVANRRCFDDRLQIEWQRSLRQQEPLALILLDIDYFKHYNDHYGHQMGDDCLCQIAQTATQHMKRPTDLFARYGGEEFVVLLPNTDLEGAITVAKSIQSAIQRLGIPHQTSRVSQQVTVSMGIASVLPSAKLSPDDLITLADKHLYQAKERGRNQIYGDRQIG